MIRRQWNMKREKMSMGIKMVMEEVMGIGTGEWRAQAVRCAQALFKGGDVQCDSLVYLHASVISILETESR